MGNKLTAYTKKELRAFRKKLEVQRAILSGDMGHMEEAALKRNRQDSSGDLSNMPFHLADVSSDNYEQEMTLGFMENKGEVLSQIEDALENIQNGSYGTCEKCKKKIPKARLEAIPYTRFCVSCQSGLERVRRRIGDR